MTLQKRTVVDQTAIDEFGNIHIRTATVIEDDGVEIARAFHREVLTPGDPLNGKDAKVAAIADVVWTPEVIATASERKAQEGELAARLPRE